MFKHKLKHSLSLLVALVSFHCSSSEYQQSRPIELRGVWITNVDSKVLESRENIAEAMQFLADHNFNVVFPVVWHNGVTLFRSSVMKRTFGTEIDTLYMNRDPLAEVIEEAHKRTIAVIPWFEHGFVSSYEQNGGMILQKKPHWAARDREGKLLTKNGFVWINGLHPEVQQFMLSLVSEVVKNYNVDGVQGDDRLPAEPIEGGYDSLTQAMYAEEHAGNHPPLNIHETHWKYWRAVRLSVFAQQLFWKVKALKSDAVVSWAPGVYPASLNEYLQDWRAWVNEGPNGEYYADIVNPQIYRDDIEKYKRTLDSQHRDSLKINTKKRYMYPAMLLSEGGYLMSDDFLKEAVRYNRYSGYNGEVFFSYEGLRKDNDRLAKILKETFYKTPATLPFTLTFQKRR